MSMESHADAEMQVEINPLQKGIMICDKIVNGVALEMYSLEISNFSFETSIMSIKSQIESVALNCKWNDLEFGGFIFLRAPDASTSNRLILLGSYKWLSQLINNLPNFSNDESFYIRNNAPNGNNLLITLPQACNHGEIEWIENKRGWIDARNLTWITREWMDDKSAIDKIISIVKEAIRYFLIETVKEKEYIIYRIGFYNNDAGRRIQELISDHNNMFIEGRWNCKLSLIPAMMSTDPEFIPATIKEFKSEFSTDASQNKNSYEKAARTVEFDSYVLHRKVKEKAISRKEAEKLIGLRIRSERQFNACVNKHLSSGCKPYEEKKFRGDRDGRGRGRGHFRGTGCSSHHHHHYQNFYRVPRE